MACSAGVLELFMHTVCARRADGRVRVCTRLDGGSGPPGRSEFVQDAAEPQILDRQPEKLWISRWISQVIHVQTPPLSACKHPPDVRANAPPVCVQTPPFLLMPVAFR